MFFTLRFGSWIYFPSSGEGLSLERQYFIYYYFFNYFSSLAVTGIRTSNFFVRQFFGLLVRNANHWTTRGPKIIVNFCSTYVTHHNFFLFYFGSNYWAYVNARLANYMVCTMDECRFLEFPDPLIFFLTYYACFLPLESVFLFPWVFRYFGFMYFPICCVLLVFIYCL